MAPKIIPANVYNPFTKQQEPGFTIETTGGEKTTRLGSPESWRENQQATEVPEYHNLADALVRGTIVSRPSKK